MPEYVTMMMPHPKPDVNVLAEVYAELAEANKVKFLRCKYRPDDVTLRVVWQAPRDAPRVVNAFLMGLMEVGIVQALKRQAEELDVG